MDTFLNLYRYISKFERHYFSSVSRIFASTSQLPCITNGAVQFAALDDFHKKNPRRELPVVCTIGINYTQSPATNISLSLFSYLRLKDGAPGMLTSLPRERYACAVACAAYNRNLSNWIRPLQTQPDGLWRTHGSRDATRYLSSLGTTANAVGTDFILLMTNLSPFITTAQWSDHAKASPWACRALLGTWPSHLHVNRLLRFLSKRVDLWLGHSSIYGTDWVWPEFSSYIKTFKLQSLLLTGNISHWGAISMESAFALRTHPLFPLYGY
jgi:hypothetical protein